MKNILVLVVLLFSFTQVSCADSTKKPRILVFSKTEGYRHESIPDGIKAFQSLGQQHDFIVDATEDATKFTDENLKQYVAIVFLNTTGDVLNESQQQAFTHYMRNGGGFIGIHAATDTEYDWPWYGKMVGAYFESHPDQQKATLNSDNLIHPATRWIPKVYEHFDEWYNFKNVQPDLDILVTVDESTYHGGKHGTQHPISWSQIYDGGRVFYTALGHTKESYKNKYVLTHILGGLEWVIGDRNVSFFE
ncbi:ThuA domain-containing protein [Aureisphaera galaxeae]|uniref:ThuA domain-containing protein n=1 Tax=Aureisphaera galaxeae TaxID=1538023 RepID=UPI00234FE2FB|nr:ThuA domain-containing protein [Aureisphaera galaxeae]MDC8004235.1 ThuA domain-containing protein [Aureisphaera galaxeae]